MKIPDNPQSAFLAGVFTALTFDDKVTEAEARFLVEFIKKRPDLLDAEILAPHLAKIVPALRSDYLSRENCLAVKDLIFAALGVGDPAFTNPITEIPFTAVEIIEFDGRGFVVTGEFQLGRGSVEGFIEGNGGEVKGSCSRLTDYLIVGSIPDPAWKFGNYGTKIKAAVTLKKAGHGITIVSEEIFTKLHADGVKQSPTRFERHLKRMKDDPDWPP